MSNKIEYSRLVNKRTTVPSQLPTINTATTIDNTWLSSDILIGEMFMNIEDDRVFTRTNNGIFEFNIFSTGSTSYDFCDTGILTTGITSCVGPLSISSSIQGNTCEVFDDTFSIAFGRDNNSNAPNSTCFGGLFNNVEAGRCFIFGGAFNLIEGSGPGNGIYGGVSNVITGFTTNTSNIFGGRENIIISNSSTILGAFKSTGSTDYSCIAGGSNHLNAGANSFIGGGNNSNIDSTATNSALLGGNGNSIGFAVDRSVVLGGNGITATQDDTAYVDNLNINTVGAGTSVNNLGIDSNGNVVVGSLSSGSFLPLSGGTLTGQLNIQDDISFENSIVRHSNLIQTTNATTATILTIPTSFNNIYQIEVNVVAGRNNTSRGFTSKIIGSFRNNLGTLIEFGQQTELSNSEFTTANVSLEISGANILVRVTGEVTTAIDWGANSIIHVTPMGTI